MKRSRVNVNFYIQLQPGKRENGRENFPSLRDNHPARKKSEKKICCDMVGAKRKKKKSIYEKSPLILGNNGL